MWGWTMKRILSNIKRKTAKMGGKDTVRMTSSYSMLIKKSDNKMMPAAGLSRLTI